MDDYEARSPNLTAPDQPEEQAAEINLSLRQLNSRNPRTRSQAARRLGELRAEPDALIALLGDANPYVRSAAADALGYAAGSREGKVVDYLLTLIDDPNNYVCASAIHALGILRASSAAAQLHACLDDPNPFIVQAAVLALARMQDPGLGEQLVQFLDSENYLILLSTTRAIGILQYAPAAPLILRNLETMLEDRDEREFKLPKAYIETLARLKAREAVPLLIQIASQHVGLRSVSVEALISLHAEEAAPLLVPMLSDPSERLRRHLIALMVISDYRVALEVIRGLLKDPSAQIRSAALEAVHRWEDAASVTQVRRMAYHDPNPFIRPQAVTCLAVLARREAISDLTVLKQDLNVQVRLAAETSLVHINQMADGENGELVSEPAGTLSEGEVLTFASQEETGDQAGIPPGLDPQALLSWLEIWQAGLSFSPGEQRLEEALQILIARLKEK